MERVLSLEVEELGGDRRWFRLEASASCPLPRLNAWLSERFGLGEGLRYGFRLAGRGEYEECTFFGPGSEYLLPAERARLDDLALVAGRRLLHSSLVSPLRERVVRVLEVRDGDPPAEDLRETERGERGRSPGGIPDPDELFWRLLRQAGRQELELEGQDWAEEVERRRQLAHDVATLAAVDPRALEQAERVTGALAFEWVEDLPLDLHQLGREQEAFDVLPAMAAVLGEEPVRSLRQQLLVEVGRADEAREDARRWLEEQPGEAWIRVYVAQLYRELGEPGLAEEEYRRALELEPEDLEARSAALGDLVDMLVQAGRIEEVLPFHEEHQELEARIERLEEEEAEADLDAEDLDLRGDVRPQVGRNDPCPCGSGTKFKRCCMGALSEAASSDLALLDRLLEELSLASDDAGFQRRLDEQLGRLAGDGLVGWSVARVLPVLPSDELAEACLDWGLLDLDLGQGRTLLDVVEHRRRKTLTRRERGLLEQLRASSPSAWRVESITASDDGHRARLVDLLEAAAPPVEVVVGPGSSAGSVVLARLLELDGMRYAAPGPVHLDPEVGERLVPRLRRRFGELRSADPDSAWPDFRKRHSAELYREAIAVLREEQARL